MKAGFPAFLLILLIGLVAYLPRAAADPEHGSRPFRVADLNVEIDATAGSAGLQILLDDAAWQQVTVVDPAGREIADVEATGPMRDFGLGELRSGSAQPSLRAFPLADFRELFPAGAYTFTGTLVDGTRLRSEVPLTHAFPDGARIVKPRNGAELARGAVAVGWQPGQPRPGVTVIGYQVAVARRDGTKAIRVDLPASARELPIPPPFLQRRTAYEAEVRTIETSGNQTRTEVAFTVA